MLKHYTNYIWKAGKPYGISAIENPQGITYKIVSDPYYKRLSVEKYQEGQFVSLIYDSALFDFRHLKPAEQVTWQKIMIQESSQKAICHIRNQDDRLILIEEYVFENNLCRECFAKHPKGILISSQKMFYIALGDPFNGVILYDANQHPVVFKQYQVDEESTFTTLIAENWDMTSQTSPIAQKAYSP